jgi:hypothetical protein
MEAAMHKRGTRDPGWSWALILIGLAPIQVRAQDPAIPDGSAPVCQRQGRLHRMFHHVAHTVQDKAIGYPDTFIEPPLGFYVGEQFAVQVGKADPHRFTLYRTDFLPGTDLFSPMGASRFNLMFGRLPAWAGPVVVEWTPDQPALAQARRRAVLATLERAGRPVVAERVVIGPSPYPGLMGLEGANNFMNTIGRSQSAALSFPLSPTESAAMGVR